MVNEGGNIIVFGQTGSGKSSLINMLACQDVAEVSNAAFGATPYNNKITVLAPWAKTFRVRESNSARRPPAPIPGGSLDGTDRSPLWSQQRLYSNSSAQCNPNEYTFWDTAGLNEDERGTVPPAVAYANLINLARDTGLNLIIYCVRASRFTEAVRINYDLFWKIICDKKVPIVLVVTGLEQEERMDAWWDLHKADFEEMGMTFVGHACVTTIRGRNNIYNWEYHWSREKVWGLIKEHCSPVTWRTKKQPNQVIETMEWYLKHYNTRTTRNRLLEWPLRLGKFCWSCCSRMAGFN